MFQSLEKEMRNAQVDFKTSFGGFCRDYQQYRESGANLTFMTMKEFMNTYIKPGEKAHWLKWGMKELMKGDCNLSRYQIYLLVDISEEKHHTMNKDMKKKYKKAGLQRRYKLDEKYKYKTNTGTGIWNRIHSYIVVEHSPGLSDKKTLAINIICSSNYSDIKGVGSYTMKTLLESARNVGYSTVVLEVGSDEIEEKEEESEEESDEESEEESEEEEELEEDEESRKQLLHEYWVNESMDHLCDISSNALWKKSVRHNNGVPYYSFGEEYLSSIIRDNIENEETEQELPDIVDIKDDEEYAYHGFYYNKSKRHSKNLITYYETFGFKEDVTVHKDLKCFSELPFPSMKLSL